MSKNLEDRFVNKPVRTSIGIGLKVIFVITVLIVAGWVVKSLLFIPSQIMAVGEKTFNATNMIYNYEWFKQQHEDIKAFKQRYEGAVADQKAFEASAGERSTWKTDDRQEWNRLNMAAQGLRSQRQSLIADYNGRSKMVNRSIFKAGDTELPNEIRE